MPWVQLSAPCVSAVFLQRLGGILSRKCLQVGEHFLERLRVLQDKHDIIGDVRGVGLMLGVELVSDRGAKTPAKAETVQVIIDPHLQRASLISNRTA